MLGAHSVSDNHHLTTTEAPMLKETTQRHLAASKARRVAQSCAHTKSSFLQSLSARGSKDAAKILRKAKKNRKALANSLREKRREHGHHLARVWHRAGGE